MKNQTIQQIIQTSMTQCSDTFKNIEQVAVFNQKKVLDSFISRNVALRHFNGTSGYGYDDVGREVLGKVFADIFSTEAAIVSPLIANGTHALTLALFGLLRPNDTMLSISGDVYDTLNQVISGENVGSLKEFGINFQKVDLAEGQFDLQKIQQKIKQFQPKIVYIQRSRGYEWRQALSISKIEKACQFVKKLTDAKIVVDNCYGEFVEKLEPTEVGADVCVGSLIKNIGGGLCPTGGYIAGDGNSIEKIGGKLTAPGIGTEVGSYLQGYQNFYQGLFFAPHVVSQALKTAVLFATAMRNIGFEVLPSATEQLSDIICSIKFNDQQKLIKFVQSIQASSPVDGFVTPQPWDMPGYNDKVIMAAGCFVQGASIELSCDAPIRPPYIAYLQGGLTFEHGIIALERVLQQLLQ